MADATAAAAAAIERSTDDSTHSSYHSDQTYVRVDSVETPENPTSPVGFLHFVLRAILADMSELADIAPAFVEMAHRIVWCTVATLDTAGRPSTRVLHPIWEFDGDMLTGWIATSPQSLKARHLAANPSVSLTYWSPTQDVATADCDTTWTNDMADRRAGWDRFANGPVPVGYDPAIIPGWTSPEADSFGVLRLAPRALRVMPGSVLMTGQGDTLTWRH